MYTSNLIDSTSFTLNTESTSKNPNKQNSLISTLQCSNSIEDVIQIKVRVSNLNYNDQDLKFKIILSQTVRQLKNQIMEVTGIDTSRQRLFFGGRLMKDRQKLGDHRLKKNVVVQAIVREAKIIKDEILEDKENKDLKI